MRLASALITFMLLSGSVFAAAGDFTAPRIFTAKLSPSPTLGISATDISVTGNVTANAFAGDGSGLTGITANVTSLDYNSLTSVPTQVAAVSNSGGINLSSLGVTGTVTATTLSGTYVYGNQISATALYVGGLQITSTTDDWYRVQRIPVPVQSVSNSGAIILNSLGVTNGVTATTLSGTFVYGNQASFTTINIGACTGAGCGAGSSSWYGLTNIPTYVQNVSNSTYLFLTGLGVNGTVTATTLSGTYVYGNQISGTTIAGTLSTPAQGNVTSLGTLTGLTINGVLTMTGATNTVTATRVYAATISSTAGTIGSLAATLSTAAQGNITSLGTLTGLTVAGTVSATQAVRAWVSYSCAPSSCSIIDGFNVSSVTYQSTGTQRINMTNALNSTSYGIGCTGQRSGGGDAINCAATNQFAKTTTVFEVANWATSTEIRTDTTQTTVWVFDN